MVRRDGQFINALIAVTLAPQCACCNRPLDKPLHGPVCDVCWASIRPLSPPFCIRCGDPLPSWRTISLAMSRCARCRRSNGALDCARAAGDYEGALRQIIHAFKYEGRRSLAVPLGLLLRHAGRDIVDDTQCLVPVPLHLWRRLTRGFNQAADLAATFDRPVVHALRRHRATRSQTGLTAAGRRRNVSGAFRLAAVARGSIAGKRVLLVDDVRTTGATLDACARVLKEAGAREVRALTLARAVPALRSRSELS